MDKNVKVCEYCGTENDAKAQKCKYCHEWLIVDTGEWTGRSRTYTRVDPGDLDQVKAYEKMQKYQGNSSYDRMDGTKTSGQNLVIIGIVFALIVFVVVAAIAFVIPAQILSEDSDDSTSITSDWEDFGEEAIALEFLAMGWEYGVENDRDGIFYEMEIKNIDERPITGITVYTTWYDHNGHPFQYVDEGDGYLSDSSKYFHNITIQPGETVNLTAFAELSLDVPYGISIECAHPYSFDVQFEDGTYSWFDSEIYWYSEYYKAGHPMDYVPIEFGTFLDSISTSFPISAELLNASPIEGSLLFEGSSEKRAFELEIYYYDPVDYSFSGFITWKDNEEWFDVEGYAYLSIADEMSYEINTLEGDGLYLSLYDNGTSLSGSWWSYESEDSGTVEMTP